MSASEKKPAPVIPDAAQAAEKNPNVDIEQLREAETLLDELSEQGVGRRQYDIASPYEHRPLRRKR